MADKYIGNDIPVVTNKFPSLREYSQESPPSSVVGGCQLED